MSQAITKGSTGNSVRIFIPNSTVNTGAGKTGLLFNTAGLEIYYSLGARGALTSITLVTLASLTASWASGGFILASDTNARGVYRLDLPNAAVPAANDPVNEIFIHVKHGSDWAEQSMVIPLLEPVNANGGAFDANTKKINDVTIVGNGVSPKFGV